MSGNNIKLSENIELAPFRTIDEFVLDKARFQLPTFNNLKKWNNRVVTNLLYYQTNYFAVALTIVALCGFMHSRDIVVGASAIGLLAATVLVMLSKNGQLLKIRADHPYLIWVAFAIAGYYFIYVLPSVVILLFTFAFPVLIVFVHASLRLRNLNAKVNIKMEAMELRFTVMGQLFDLLNVDINEP
ncbi:PRA1 family protein [Aphelenchoides besseyi]|nr:PRA1 family protein [Aphelenchoides besseyi]KAI6236263.1 PRA1 family protein [Aphelenchoides besseyi]